MSLCILQVPDEVVIGFFTTVFAAGAAAIVMLWKRQNALEDKIHECIKDIRENSNGGRP